MLVGSAAMIGSVAVVGVLVLGRVDAHTPATAPEALVGAADLSLGGGPECIPTRTEQLVRGNGVGSTGSGPDVILAFQHAYYVARSGLRARAVTTPDAWVSPAAVIDVGIATVPTGTRHCVEVAPQPDGRFAVTITENRLDRSVRTYRQEVTVEVREGSTVITRIDPVRPRR
ncbi:hypothetical protein [Nocardia mexicana]|uniref:DUF8176 domain-containing protein n=1 Tax=Nocardia mexicana TaxID=279262 RepID=A0A370HFW0_9NOCA|nr:hypothetical protein [Nocardia mexicana]RDI55905.1 hypothetical protein DFR68_101741 [Nocardia mexicana]